MCLIKVNRIWHKLNILLFYFWCHIHTNPPLPKTNNKQYILLVRIELQLTFSKVLNKKIWGSGGIFYLVFFFIYISDLDEREGMSWRSPGKYLHLVNISVNRSIKKATSWLPCFFYSIDSELKNCIRVIQIL